MKKIERGTKLFLERLQKQFLYMLLIAALFMYIGLIVPKLYYQYFDSTQYYTLEQPVKLSKQEYKACDSVQLILRRSVKENLVVDVYNTLIRVNDTQVYERVYSPKSLENIVIDQGNNLEGIGTIILPCDTQPGIYFWQGIVKYMHEDQEYTYPYISNLFNVIE